MQKRIDELASTQDELVKGQKAMSTMMEEMHVDLHAKIRE
jgi:hypothetical protein